MKVKLTYFKQTGKYYTEAETTVDTDGFYTAIDEIRRRAIWSELPGLESGAWSGPIMVTINDLPHLILE
tara:strand:- start:260 stop:466 length:207 start_codon:yes stop_codon:yes gene_type:complete